jgi:purine-nucleoside phosphorylase
LKFDDLGDAVISFFSCRKGDADLPENEAIVNPRKTRHSPDIGPVAVMTATRPDLDQLGELLHFAKDDFQRLFLSRLYVDRQHPGGWSVVGPFVGAPYAVLLLENLIAWGAHRIIVVGWCGAISEKVNIGDLILPTSAISDEGTSKHYGLKGSDIVQAAFPLVSGFRQILATNDYPFHEGKVWTTDALYRETRQAVAAYRENGVLAVDMEVSALFSTARFRAVDLAALLVVSDELSSLNWRPGFTQQRFKESCKAACRLVADMLGDAVLA